MRPPHVPRDCQPVLPASPSPRSKGRAKSIRLAGQRAGNRIAKGWLAKPSAQPAERAAQNRSGCGTPKAVGKMAAARWSGNWIQSAGRLSVRRRLALAKAAWRILTTARRRALNRLDGYVAASAS